MTYLNLDEEYLEKNKKKMKKLAIEDMGDDGKDSLRIDIKDEVDFEFDKGTITLDSCSDMGFISVKYTLDDNECMEIVEYMKKKASKLKELLKLND